MNGTEKVKKIYRKKYIKYKKRFTIIMAITNKRVIHYTIITNSANAKDFKNFILDTNKKYNLKNKYILMDNARIHHAKINKYVINNLKSNTIYNVLYYPEYNQTLRQSNATPVKRYASQTLRQFNRTCFFKIEAIIKKKI